MSDLVGKWVLCQPVIIGAVCHSVPLLVTSASGKRIYVSKLLSEWDRESGSYKFTDEVADDGFKKLDSVVFAFNTMIDAVEVANTQRKEHEWWWSDAKKKMQKAVRDKALELGGAT